jgi:hypothetical protein
MTLEFMVIALLAGHALADYPLQGDFLSKAKNRAAPIPGVPYWQALGAHVAIHGAFVACFFKRRHCFNPTMKVLYR